jgi:hypothetical protein
MEDMTYDDNPSAVFACNTSPPSQSLSMARASGSGRQRMRFARSPGASSAHNWGRASRRAGRGSGGGQRLGQRQTRVLPEHGDGSIHGHRRAGQAIAVHPDHLAAGQQLDRDAYQ